MNVSLTSHLEEFIDEQVKAGRYQTASEVVRDGLRLLEERLRTNEAKFSMLREAITEGLASGPADELDIDQVIAQAQKRRAAR